MYVNTSLLGQKSQVSFLWLGYKRIHRQAEKTRGSVSHSILAKGLKDICEHKPHNLGHIGNKCMLPLCMSPLWESIDQDLVFNSLQLGPLQKSILKLSQMPWNSADHTPRSGIPWSTWRRVHGTSCRQSSATIDKLSATPL